METPISSLLLLLLLLLPPASPCGECNTGTTTHPYGSIRSHHPPHLPLLHHHHRKNHHHHPTKAPPPPSCTINGPPPPPPHTPPPPPPSCTINGPSPPPQPPPPEEVQPPPPGGPKCSIDALRLGLCLDVLGGLVHVGFGDPAVENTCCPVLHGLLEIDAAVCMCAAIRLKVLDLEIYVKLAMDVLVTCGKNPPQGSVCSAY